MRNVTMIQSFYGTKIFPADAMLLFSISAALPHRSPRTKEREYVLCTFKELTPCKTLVPY